MRINMRIVHEHKQLLQNPSQCEGFGCEHCHLYSIICNIRHCNKYFLQLRYNPLYMALKKTKQQHTSLKLVCCSFFYYLIEPLNVPYELLYDEFLESQLTMRKYFPLPLNRRILRPRYVEYPHRLLYCGWQFVR